MPFLAGLTVFKEEEGQSTIEYALITAGFLAILIALGAFHTVVEQGLFVDHALMSASHQVQAVAPGSAADVFLY